MTRLSLPLMDYKYSSLEPFFDERTMIIHHTKHHQAYVNNANDVLQNISCFNNFSDEDIIKNLDKAPKVFRNRLRNSLGGHFNHSLFWKFLKKDTVLDKNFQNIIELNFGDFNSFKKKFEQAAINFFGSGWVWLVVNSGKLNIVSTINQDNPLMGESICNTSGYPILCIDLWEHAYYIKYQNRKLDYIKSFWNVVNWDEVYKRFRNTLK